MVNILLNGYNGAMGKVVRDIAGNFGVNVKSGADITCEDGNGICVKNIKDADNNVDAVLDFSNHLSTKDLTDFCVKNALPLVVATTGQTEEELNLIKTASEKIPVFLSANMSMGIACLLSLAKLAAKTMTNAQIEIIETHHIRKADAPSGTAKMIVKAIQEELPGYVEKDGRAGYGKREPNEIGVQSVRYGNVVGIHEVIISTGNETITLRHEASSRALFAEGALKAVDFIKDKKPGLYTMKDMING